MRELLQVNLEGFGYLCPDKPLTHVFSGCGLVLFVRILITMEKNEYV